jgi:hypothetical protein
MIGSLMRSKSGPGAAFRRSFRRAAGAALSASVISWCLTRCSLVSLWGVCCEARRGGERLGSILQSLTLFQCFRLRGCGLGSLCKFRELLISQVPVPTPSRGAEVCVGDLQAFVLKCYEALAVLVVGLVLEVWSHTFSGAMPRSPTRALKNHQYEWGMMWVCLPCLLSVVSCS